jgi:hypothetical protein
MEKERQYKFSNRFALYEGHNIISLFFDEKGTFVKINSYVLHKYSNATLKETEQDHIKETLTLKKDVEKILQKLITLTSFVKIRIKEEKYYLEDEGLSITFKCDDLMFKYYIDINNPQKNDQQCIFFQLETGERLCPFLENILSLKGLEEVVLNHAQLRVKYVNELARYQKNRI